MLGAIQIALLGSFLLKFIKIKEINFLNFEFLLVLSTLAVYIFSIFWLKEKRNFLLSGKDIKGKIFGELCFLGSSFGFLISITQPIVFVFNLNLKSISPILNLLDLLSHLFFIYVSFLGFWALIAFLGLFGVLSLLEKFKIGKGGKVYLIIFFILLGCLGVYFFRHLLEKLFLSWGYFFETGVGREIFGIIMISPAYGFLNILFFPERTPLYKNTD